MKKTRFLLVGLGHIGLRHARIIQAHPEAELAGVCDIRPQRKALLPDSSIPFYENLETMIRQTEADVLSVCTPNAWHEPHSCLGLKHGLHVLVEKPMALSTVSCDRMMDTARAFGKSIFVVKQNRYNPPVAALKQKLEKGELGRIFTIQVNGFWNRSDAYYAQSAWRGTRHGDGGCLFTQFSHFVDILYYLNGSISEIQGRVENYAHRHNTEIEDTGCFMMKAENGALVNFHYTTCAYGQNMEGSISLFAEKGTYKIGGQYLNTLEYQCGQGDPIPPLPECSAPNHYGLYQGSMSNHEQVIDNVIEVLRRQGRIMTRAEEGREVVSIIERMYEAVGRPPLSGNEGTDPFPCREGQSTPSMP